MISERQFQQWTSNINSRTAHALLALTFALTLAVVSTRRAQAQTYSVLYTFTGGADGGWPYSGVILDEAGNLYGTTEVRGNVGACGLFHGCGVVYKLDPSGKETVLHTFEGGSDGRQPQWGNLFRDKAGNLLDTTLYGGLSVTDVGGGVVYKVTKTGKETILHKFAGGPTDGLEPQTGLIQDAAGTFYGTTAAGGSGPFGQCGTVFKMSKSGKVSVLHSFLDGDGCQPIGGLVMDAVGNMYGVTSSGGSTGLGTVFKITKTGKVTSLHTFTGEPDGALPLGILVLDKAGNIYGTTPNGGDPNCTTQHQGCGIVFKIDTRGKEHILHSFLLPEGGLPYAGLLLDAAGNLYGTTSGFAAHNWGSIFKLDKKRKFTKLYDFTGGADGGFPFAGLTQDKAGNFYGTAYLGGLANGCDDNNGCGVVFKLTP
jgi:uncharacterized repeat protein (TIGR03803 family)